MSFCHTENHRNGEKKDPCCKLKQNACLEVTGSNLERWGKRKGTREGRGEKDIKSRLVCDGCHHRKQDTEETSSTDSALQCWSRQQHLPLMDSEWGPNAALRVKAPVGWSALKRRIEDLRQPKS